MKKLMVDANVFLRFLTDDIPEQAAKVEKCFKESEKGKLQLLVSHITAVEVLFQLERWYKVNKAEAVEKLIHLFSPSWIQVEGKDILFEALQNYKTRNVDFVDLLLWSIAKKHHYSILSFDKDFDLLTPRLRITP